jgi:hypothetical protein
MKCIAAMNTKRMRYLAALLFCITLLPACAARSEDWEVRVINGDTGKPEPGVMVLHWRTGRTTGILGNYSGYCDNEHIAVTDEHGMVKVPSDITGTPWRYAMVGVEGNYGTMAYKRGMVVSAEIEKKLGNPPRKLTKEERMKEPNLFQILTIRTDTREPIHRSLYLLDSTPAGCTCSRFTKALFKEAREIYTPPPGTGLATQQIDERYCK